MAKNENKPIISPSTTKHAIRALLRTLPFVPAPELYDIIQDLKLSRSSVDEKIEKAYKSLQEISGLVNELEGNLKERNEKIALLRKEYERDSKLAEVEADKVKAVIQQLEISLRKGKGIERWVSLGINIAAGIIVFALGIFLSPIIKGWLGIGG